VHRVEVLSNVLHVPELEHHLFSVRKGLARRWDVLFAHPEQFGFRAVHGRTQTAPGCTAGASCWFATL
jgi:hypothetical protein